MDLFHAKMSKNQTFSLNFVVLFPIMIEPRKNIITVPFIWSPVTITSG